MVTMKIQLRLLAYLVLIIVRHVRIVQVLAYLATVLVTGYYTMQHVPASAATMTMVLSIAFNVNISA